MISRFAGVVDEYIVVRARGQVLPAVSRHDLTIVDDLYPETGPLGGMYTGLATARSPQGFVVACDMPLLQRPLITELLRLAPEYDLVVPVSEEFTQPLCAVYSKACLEPMRRQLESGALKVTGFFQYLMPRYVLPDEWRTFDPDGLSFQNLNCEEDLERVKGLLVNEAVR